MYNHGSKFSYKVPEYSEPVATLGEEVDSILSTTDVVDACMCIAQNRASIIGAAIRAIMPAPETMWAAPPVKGMGDVVSAPVESDGVA